MSTYYFSLEATRKSLDLLQCFLTYGSRAKIGSPSIFLCRIEMNKNKFFFSKLYEKSSIFLGHDMIYFPNVGRSSKRLRTAGLLNYSLRFFIQDILLRLLCLLNLGTCLEWDGIGGTFRCIICRKYFNLLIFIGINSKLVFISESTCMLCFLLWWPFLFSLKKTGQFYAL